MTNRDSESDLPVVRRVDLRSPLKPSRLLERGIAALVDERMAPLDILRLIAFESSVFVLSTDWDAQASEYLIFSGDFVKRDRGLGNRDLDYDDEPSNIESLRNTRRFTMYEFHRTGYFIQKLTMELIRLTEEGYEQLERRSPGRPMISSNFIHFHEVLMMGGSLPDVRIDYLFSRKGERLGVWSDHRFPSLFRAPDQTLVPIFRAFRPEWAVLNTLLASIAIEDDEDNVFAGSVALYVANHEWVAQKFSIPDYPGSCKYIFEYQNYGKLIDKFKNVHMFKDYPSGQLCAGVKGNPLEEFEIELETFENAWNMTTSDPQGLWFMDTESAEIWRIEFAVGEIRSSPCYELSHPMDWIRDGLIGIIGPQHDEWKPSSEDYERLHDVYQNQLPFKHLECELWGAWGDDVIIEVSASWRSGYSWASPEPILLLFRVNDDKMSHVKLLDPFKDVQRALTFDDSMERDHENAVRVQFRHPLANSRYVTFSERYLYSFCDGGERAISILVTDIVTNECVRFRPEVPAD